MPRSSPTRKMAASRWAQASRGKIRPRRCGTLSRPLVAPKPQAVPPLAERGRPPVIAPTFRRRLLTAPLIRLLARIHSRLRHRTRTMRRRRALKFQQKACQYRGAGVHGVGWRRCSRSRSRQSRQALRDTNWVYRTGNRYRLKLQSIRPRHRPRRHDTRQRHAAVKGQRQATMMSLRPKKRRRGPPRG